jgi:hypothetical protein
VIASDASKMKSTRRTNRVLWVCLLLTSLACTETHRVRPTQLGQLNDDLATNHGERLKVKLETTDGRIVEVDPPVVVRITTSDGRERIFCSPLRARFERGNLFIKHNCGRPVRIDGNEISKVEVEEF